MGRSSSPAKSNPRAKAKATRPPNFSQFNEREDGSAYIEATVFVEKESHKGIVIGKGGAMLRALGTTARGQIEAMSGRKVYLRLRVKVQPGWRDNQRALRELGYDSRE